MHTINLSNEVVARWQGGKGAGLSLVGAKIEASKHRKRYPRPNYVVETELLDWKNSRGSQVYGVVVREVRSGKET